MISKVKGTQDWLNLQSLNSLVDLVKKHFKNYNVAEIKTPILEHVSLFKRTLGKETDVVSKEMFIIESRTQKDDQICLRPEMTASVMRACIENKIQHFPWKVFSIGPCFRYERPQKGRFRQFHQINLELIGCSSLVYDVECIMMLDRLFGEVLQITNLALHLNFLGCFDDRAQHKKILSEFITQLPDNSICDRCVERSKINILRIFDCKNDACQELYKKAPVVTDCLCNACESEWQELQKMLSMQSVSFVHNPKLVRGLDYYNKTVFEFVSTSLGAQNAFCGGGRYNQLATQLGAKNDLLSIGAAIGIERLLLILEAQQNSILQEVQKKLSLIVPFDKAQYTVALLLADNLRAKDICIDLLIDGSIKNRMKKANTLGAQFVLLIGQDEQDAGVVSVKNMITGAQESVAMNAVGEYLV